MKNGQCPKCNSNNVFSGATMSKFSKNGVLHSNSIPLVGGIFCKATQLDNYVCVDCGYVESYISDKKALEYITKKWPRAGS